MESGSEDNTINIWDINTGESLITFFGYSSVVRCLLSYDEKTLISVSYDSSIIISNFKDLSIRQKFNLNENHTVFNIIKLRNGLFASSSGEKSINIWYL